MIDCRIDGHIALLTLNNPAANTFTADSLLQLERTVGELNRNTQVYAVVITGQGEKFFSAGAGLSRTDCAFAHGLSACGPRAHFLDGFRAGACGVRRAGDAHGRPGPGAQPR